MENEETSSQLHLKCVENPPLDQPKTNQMNGCVFIKPAYVEISINSSYCFDDNLCSVRPNANGFRFQ
jgi:hypothetical protein